MRYKEKLILLSLLLSLTSYGAIDIDGVYVNGSDTVERVEDSYILSSGTGSESTPINNIAVVENGGTLDNWGSIGSTQESYKSTGIIGLVGVIVANELDKEEELVILDKSILNNNGKIEMKGYIHEVNPPLLSIAGFLGGTYADYTRTVITSKNSNIENNSNIIRGRDSIIMDINLLSISLLSHSYLNYTKNIISLTEGKMINTGKITAEGDIEIQHGTGLLPAKVLSYVTYNRNNTGITSTNSNVINKESGEIRVRGDVFSSGRGFEAIKVDALSALIGENNKIGIKANGGIVENKGYIQVERDYSYGLAEDGFSLIKVELINKDELIGANVLTFDNMKETSIGISLSNNAVLNNNGGTIEVGVNYGNGSKAIAMDAQNSTINFNGGNIKLEGIDVYATNLNNSNITFRGTTTIDYLTNSSKVNRHIFNNVANSNHYIKGDLIVNGDLTINQEDNIVIGLAENPIINKDGSYSLVVDKEGNKKVGQITVNGIYTGQGNVKIETSSLVGKNFEDYIGNTVVVAENILGETGVDSDSYLFNISGEKIESNEKEEIVISDITRKDFNDIVINNQLATIFEASYDNANTEQLQVYKILAQGSDAQEFNQIVDEVTGKDTLTTLNSQIYDITKDLNKQFKNFVKTNNQDGVVFKYINSKSELGANSSTVGFERESSGIMVGYNNSISEKLRFGAGFSYMKSDINYTSASSNNITTWNFRGYSDYNLGFANIFSDLSFGYNRAENKRVAEQISYTGIKEGDLDVYSLSLNNSFYKNYQFNDKLSLTTSVNFDFIYLYQKDFKENGTLGAEAESTDTFYITTGLGVDGKYNLISLGNSKVNLIAGMEYSYDIVSGTEDMNLKVSAFDSYYKESSRELDKKSLTYDIGLSYEYSDRYSIGAKYIKELINDIDNDQVGIDFTYKF